MRLNDDWDGADFLAKPVNEIDIVKAQLKSRLVFAKRYEGKDLYIGFRYKEEWFIFPHDLVVKVILAETNVGITPSWNVDGRYSFLPPARP